MCLSSKFSLLWALVFSLAFFHIYNHWRVSLSFDGDCRNASISWSTVLKIRDKNSGKMIESSTPPPPPSSSETMVKEAIYYVHISSAVQVYTVY